MKNTYTKGTTLIVSDDHTAAHRLTFVHKYHFDFEFRWTRRRHVSCTRYLQASCGDLLVLDNHPFC